MIGLPITPQLFLFVTDAECAAGRKTLHVAKDNASDWDVREHEIAGDVVFGDLIDGRHSPDPMSPHTPAREPFTRPRRAAKYRDEIASPHELCPQAEDATLPHR